MKRGKGPQAPWPLSSFSRRQLGFAALLFVIVAGGYSAFSNRGNFAWYRKISDVYWYRNLTVALRGDAVLDSTLKKYNVQFVAPDHKQYADENLPSVSFALKWRFRPPHAVPTYPLPPVDDTDGDGTPEVYVGSYTKGIHVLNGANGKTSWTWKIPIGVVGGRSLALVHLGNGQGKALIVGSHTTLPIRVYALSVEKDLKDSGRVLWARHVSGDFIEGGLNVGRTKEGAIRIVAATRAAPYSSGSLNILDERGNFVNSPITGLDVCLNRPAIGHLGEEGRPYVVHGSHDFNLSQYGYMVVTREMESGQMLWSRKMDFDTGNRNHAIFDFDGDGAPEVVANGEQKTVILDGRTGEVKNSFPLEFKGRFRSRDGRILFLMRKSDQYVVITTDGTTVYAIDRHRTAVPMEEDAFGVRLKGERDYSLITFAYDNERLHVFIYELETGRLKGQHRLAFDPPPRNSVSWQYGMPRDPNAPFTGWIGFVSLSDTDGDGFWEVLFQAGDYLYALDTPFEIAEGYQPYSPNPFRNINNDGIIFSPFITAEEPLSN